MKSDLAEDPKGLIMEAYRIDGITPEECRSIFLDWALSLPDEMSPHSALEILIRTYATGAEGHPMTGVMREGLTKLSAPRRRGGWKTRPRN
ncbi:hypothetical protein LCL97_05805 [Seohaeicola saemankumensis]|nr:hypothetical protein [Seohaeicola saemankumensis]MCA0870328.1 hypothetical protein [Seohaeicola saemankumensis]